MGYEPLTLRRIPRDKQPRRTGIGHHMTIAGLALVATAAFGSGVAHADLRLCNKTDNTVSIAVGYKAREGWTSEGWWNIPEQSCNTLIPGPLGARYYYIYARDAAKGGDWGGKWPMCTRAKEFTIRGTQDCVVRGYERTGFFEIDTGQQRSWTVNLTEPTRKGGNSR